MKPIECHLCPRNCGAIRNDFSGDGFCSSGLLPKVARVAPHYWEEPCISGTNGSGAIFFSGCTLKCVFCQNYTISTGNFGKAVSIETLCECYKKLESLGVHNINLVSPSHYVHAIIQSMELYKPKIPIVYNSSGYESIETLRMLDSIVDIYLPDFKYSDNYIAQKYSKVNNYVETALGAISEMIRQTGNSVIDKNGIMKKGTIIRHLILPNNTCNSIDVLDLIKQNFGTDIPVSLMAQYTPLGKAHEFSEINRTLTEHEYNKVLNYLLKIGFDGFVQELSSASESYVPCFDLEGV